MDNFRNSIVYQIYPLSFKDSNNDGIGDINGIISELPYIKSLGVDVIWLSPVYASPMDDNGYDISDYYEINPMFGTKEDLRSLLIKAHDFGLRIIMDLVVNHTSDEHIWFKKAINEPSSQYFDFYIWTDKPNDIQSVFSGSAWTYQEKLNKYYFHLFSKKQPDLNWQNEDLRHEIYKMINYWIDFGFDGFRLDVIDLIGKDVAKMKLADGPYLNKHLEELYEHCFKGKHLFTVGEMPGISIERSRELTKDEKALKMIFQFDHIALDEQEHQGKWALKDLDLIKLKETFNHTQQLFSVAGWPSLFWSNHDQPRALSRYGNPDIEYRYQSSTMLFGLLFGMKGTPYIYQGEEFGMTGIKMPIEDYQDIETKNIYQALASKGYNHDDIMTSIYKKSRDNSRTPMQWHYGLYAGFSNTKPWLKINENKSYISRDQDLENKNSIIQFVRKLIKIRKSYIIFEKGDFTLIDKDHVSLFSYKRVYQNHTLVVIANWTNISQKQEIDLSGYDLILKNQTFNHNTDIPPYFIGWFIKEGEQS